jgi:formylmethanofuran dehydrogenase subunit E
VLDKWPIRREREHIQDFWRDVKVATRKFSRGWGINFQAQIKRDKSALLEKIRMLDEMAERGSMTRHQWQERYILEAKLEDVYSYEEIQLRRQNGVKWTLKGDADNSFFPWSG